MALQSIGLGTTEGDGTGDSIRDGGDKINDNFSELYTLLGTGTTLTSGISATATVVTLAEPSITGVASFADGSASAPSITNTGDANTGIFFSAADTVSVTTGGTLRTSVDSNGLSVTGSGTFSGAVQPNASDSAALGSASLEWSDLFLADSAVINFGDDQDTKLTHTDGAGLTLNSTNKIMFNDASQFIHGSSATVLSIAATDEIDLTATAVDLNGTLNVSGTLTQGGVATFVGRPVMSSGVTIADGSTIGSASTAAAMTIASTGIVTFVDDILIKNNGTIGSAGAATAMTISSAGIVTFVDDILIKNNGTIGSAGAATAMTIASTGIVTFVDDILIKDTGTIGTATTPAAITLAANGDVTFSGSISSGGSAFREQGKDTIFLPAAACQPTITNGSSGLQVVESTSGRPDMQVLDFDDGSDEHAQFQVAFPKSWNEGTVTFQVYWTTTATDTDGVAWGLQGVAVSDNDTIDIAYGTAVVVTDDALSAAEDLCITAESGAVTIAGSPAEGDMCFFRIFRDVSDGNDDMTEDARFVGIKLFFTTDAANDA